MSLFSTVRMAVDEPSREPFSRGLVMGLGAMVLLSSPRFSSPRLEEGSLWSDWEAVGRDFQSALRVADEHGL